MQITVLGGGTAGAQFLADLDRVAGSDVRLTAIVPTTNDLYAYGLKSAPDADAILSLCGTLPGGQSHRVGAALSALEVEPTWLTLDDHTLAIDLVRTELMTSGYGLTEVTLALGARMGLGFDVLPMSDDRIEQHVVVDGGEGPQAVHVTEYVALHKDEKPQGQVFIGLDSAVASSAAIEALGDSDLVLLAPASTVLHLDPLFRLPSLYKAVHDSSAPVLGVAGAPEPLRALCEVAGVAPAAREQFDDLVDAWASGTAAEVLAAGRELVGSR